MKITVIGSGYVGTTAAGIFALSGHEVVALDISKEKVEIINSGRAPFFEAGLSEIIKAGVGKGTLSATTDYKTAITGADIIFSCVGTPDKPDGSSDLAYVHQAAKSAAQYLKKSAVYIQKSTVPVGTGRAVIKLLPKQVAYVSNPEFLREGTAISDTLLFDRVVAGGDDKNAVTIVLDLHRSIESHAATIASIAGLDITDKLENHQGLYTPSGLESAELIKVTANAFLALKILFANSIAKLSDEVGANVVDVMDAVGADKRIGRSFLNAGRGYGGGCFPKDVSGLVASALEHGVDMPIMTAATEVNFSMPGYIINKVENKTGSLECRKIAVLGLSFKAGTSDARKSPAVAIANQLDKIGAKVSAYDPEAEEEAKEDLRPGVLVRAGLEKAIEGAEIIFVATDWPEFKNTDWLSNVGKETVIVDCMNCLENSAAEKDYTYIGVGR